jgi:hypothetical protein
MRTHGASYGPRDLATVSAALSEAAQAGLVDWLSVELETADGPVVVSGSEGGFSSGDLARFDALVLARLIEMAPTSLSAEFYGLSSRPTFRIDLSDGDTIVISGRQAAVDAALLLPSFRMLSLEPI